METTTAVKSSPEEKSPDRPSRIQKTPLSFTNGVLKLRHPSFSLPHAPPPESGGAYRECLKNHAAAMGGHAVDGCGEFMPPSLSTSSLLCAACGCHRNFHRRTSENNTQITEYQPLHRHLPPPPPLPDSPSPPPISSSLYPSSAPTAHMLLALSNNNNNNNNQNSNQNNNNMIHNSLDNKSNNNNSARRRFRTRFTQAQKDKMFEFAEKLTWKMQRKDEDVINAFCNSIGVEKGVFKVWMHNNKNTLGKRDSTVNNDNTNITNNNNNDNNNDIDRHRNSNHHRGERNGEEEVSGAKRVVVVGTNGSSSSS